MDVQERIASLADRAEALGADARAVRGLAGPAPDYAAALPALSDLGDTLAGMPETPEAAELRDEADAILGSLQTGERGIEPVGRDAEAIPRATFESLQAGYLDLFSRCKVKPAVSGQVAWHTGKLNQGRTAYERVGARAGIPWYFIGIIHALEASFRFNGHLHNGDPLNARTVQVPKGRPKVWNPPNDWDASAMDALEAQNFLGRTDWSLPRMLYRWEAFNGFGYRGHGIASPYLWSFSNNYDRGKYRADGVWDANLVSKQCGAAVMLRALVDNGAAALPASA